MRDYSYQLYSSRKFPPLDGTLRMLADLGYRQVEGFGGLYNDDAAVDALQAALEATGLAMPTGHMSFETVRDTPERAIAIARKLGMEAVFVPAIGERVKDAAGWAAFGKALAEAGKPIQDAGLTFGWHNHDFEFADLGGEDLPLDLFLAGGDDVTLEIDVAWVQRGGHDPVTTIQRLAPRIVAVHIKDIAPVGQAMDEDGWADVGHGVMDWPAIMGAVGQTGARYFVMEHDNPSDERRFAERSLAAAQGF